MNTQHKGTKLKVCAECSDVYMNVGGDRGGDIRLAHSRPVPKAHGADDEPKGKCPKHPR